MAEDWAADVRKYAPDADDKVISGIVRYCGIALQKRDSSLVSFSDKEELIDAANRWIAQGKGRRISYPLHEYENPAGKCKPAPGYTLHGPVLEEAYEALGRMAADFLADQPIRLQTLGLSAPRDR